MSNHLDEVIIYYGQQPDPTSSEYHPHVASTPIESAKKPLFPPEASNPCEHNLLSRHRHRQVVWRDNPLGRVAVKKHLIWQGGYSLSHGSTTACGEEAPAKTSGRAAFDVRWDIRDGGTKNKTSC
ncbi:hypothetical protein N7520_011083 [Penicillium odoratum]|uniref:uncharacterized protein n=1 Tax=Penicillium odoratum TaxID=1167516 RepID=UPI0025485D1F|nr:uncharacterized protein N7520_011083 [Penicillium odoratum]KAJ5745901.1 hypothetical protein N7520_011083 [Penicillium odoratum]